MASPFSTRTMQAADWKRLQYFTAREFRYPEAMGYEFLVWLDHLRGKLGSPLKISSDHRPPERNAAAGGASDSAHMDVPCNAVDISAASLPSKVRYRLVQLAMDLGCRRIGVYANGSVHLDRGETKPNGTTRPAPVLWEKV